MSEVNWLRNNWIDKWAALDQTQMCTVGVGVLWNRRVLCTLSRVWCRDIVTSGRYGWSVESILNLILRVRAISEIFIRNDLRRRIHRSQWGWVEKFFAMLKFEMTAIDETAGTCESSGDGSHFPLDMMINKFINDDNSTATQLFPPINFSRCFSRALFWR